jgi:NAD(P)H-dependent FMN reductase
MTRIMIIVASVRPGRLGLPIANWVRSELDGQQSIEVDFVDLAELALPFMDEPNHPRLHQYEHDHTKAWSARVEAADGFVFVTPEYNHGYAPALKNALDFLSREWFRKPISFVSYGGVSAGTRGVVLLEPTLVNLGMVVTAARVELNFAAKQLNETEEFEPTEQQRGSIKAAVSELLALSQALAPIRAPFSAGAGTPR